MDHSQINRYNESGCLYIAPCPDSDAMSVSLHRPVGIVRVTHDLQTGALVTPVATAAPSARINYVTIHFDAVVNETVTIYLNEGAPPGYDTVFFSQTLVASTDFYWYPDNDIVVDNGEGILVNVSNAGVGAPLNAYLTVSFEEFV